MRRSRRPTLLALHGITEEGGIITLFSLGESVLGRVFRWRLVFAVAASILAAEIESHEDLEADAHGDHADQDGVAIGELGRVFAQVDKACNGTAEITWIHCQS